mmetsp:Transcript_13238/g.30961  ORF Transcript_13238/g.30961 Transcript_13238/m.30961 type:complete len:207 (-) Transcript_13238:2053-2673(-)
MRSSDAVGTVIASGSILCATDSSLLESGRAARGSPLLVEAFAGFQSGFLVTSTIRPSTVWIVAPVVMSTFPSSSTVSELGAKWNRCMRTHRVISASSKANWSPMHFLGPPPNGRKAKSEDTSFGYGTLSGCTPRQPSLPSIVRPKRDGSNSLASSPQSSVERCMDHVDMKMSWPGRKLTFPRAPLHVGPVGTSSSPFSHLLMSMGG